MDRSADILINLIRYAVLDPDSYSVASEPISNEELTGLYMLAKRHSLAGMVGHALEARNLNCYFPQGNNNANESCLRNHVE